MKRMKIKMKYLNTISLMLIALTMLFTACEEEVVGPDTVPIKAEIKQVIVNNSIYRIDELNSVPQDIDTMLITIPQGTDVTQLDLDIMFSYFGSITPEPGMTDLSNPIIYTVTSNVETREIMVMAKVVPPSLTSFMMTSPREVVAQISGDSIIMALLEGIDYSSVNFVAEYFGESIDPEAGKTIDLMADPTISVMNKDFSTDYKFQIDWYKIIEFTGIIFDGTLHPNDFLPGSLEEEEVDGWIVEEDAQAYKGSVAHFISLGEKGTDGHNGQADFVYGDMGLDIVPNETTTIFRMKGIPDAEENYLEIAFKMEGLRCKLLMEFDNLEFVSDDKNKWKFLEDEEYVFDPTQWNTYRVTCNAITKEIKLYINEEEEPKMVHFLSDHGSSPEVEIGDGGSNKYESLIDYIVFETDGAYSPEDLPLSKIFK